LTFRQKIIRANSAAAYFFIFCKSPASFYDVAPFEKRCFDRNGAPKTK